MYLAPHHFQAQRRHFEDGVAHAIAALFPFAWGVSTAAIDAEALANGTLALARAQGLFPDGTPFQIPDADQLPPSLALTDGVLAGARRTHGAPRHPALAP